MKCNIDARGKLVRLVMGAVAAFPGLAILVVHWARPWESRWPVVAGAALLVVGLVGIIEGWAGWCVVRGLGFKTRI